jgi:hypothetical protein
MPYAWPLIFINKIMNLSTGLKLGLATLMALPGCNIEVDIEPTPPSAEMSALAAKHIIDIRGQVGDDCDAVVKEIWEQVLAYLPVFVDQEAQIAILGDTRTRVEMLTQTGMEGSGLEDVKRITIRFENADEEDEEPEGAFRGDITMQCISEEGE